MWNEHRETWQNPQPELPAMEPESVPFTLISSKILFHPMALLIRRKGKMAAYTATMSPERQEAFEIEMAQRQARLLLQGEQAAHALENLAFGLATQDWSHSMTESKRKEDSELGGFYDQAQVSISPEHTRIGPLVIPSLHKSIIGGFQDSGSLDRLPPSPVQGEALGESDEKSTQDYQSLLSFEDGRPYPPPTALGEASSSRVLESGNSTQIESPTDVGRFRKRNCHVCGISLTSEQNLRNHVCINPSSPALYHCPNCTSKFRHSRILAGHVKRVHRS